MFTKREQMNMYEKSQLSPGLYFVATPIGAARDITLRALDILASADVLAAEDTRTLRHLMQIHGVPVGDRQIIAYHDHNGAKVRPKLLRILDEGKSIAYASEAGTPLVADPGFPLARDSIAEGFSVHSAPGPCAAIVALSLSGMPTDRFLFAGFPPSSKSSRRSWVEELSRQEATLVIYESPKRLAKFLGELIEVMGEGRPAAICRELTKKFEEVRRGSLGELAQSLNTDPVKGEVVLVIDRAKEQLSEISLEEAVRDALKEMSVKDAVAKVASEIGVKRREVYQLALSLKEKGGD